MSIDTSPMTREDIEAEYAQMENSGLFSRIQQSSSANVRYISNNEKRTLKHTDKSNKTYSKTQKINQIKRTLKYHTQTGRGD